MPGGGDTSKVMTLGLDPQKDRSVGTRIGSMMTHLWIYAGTLDENGTWRGFMKTHYRRIGEPNRPRPENEHK